MTRRTCSVLGVLVSAVAACGGAASGAPPAAPPPSAEPAPPAPAEPAASGGASNEERPAEPAADEDGDAKPAADDTTPREKLYRMTPGGLEVEMAGVLFKIKAKAVRRGAGWGVMATVKVKSRDGEPHVLLSPEHGPLSFSAKVDRGGKADTSGDRREGDKLQTVDQDKPLELSRSWPGARQKPVMPGQSLDLQVGLWGLGPDASSQRSVRQFFEVKMVVGKGHAKPQAVVSPPASAK